MRAVRCDGNCVTLSAKAITALLMNSPRFLLVVEKPDIKPALANGRV
jgi:hypothetical protein